MRKRECLFLAASLVSFAATVTAQSGKPEFQTIPDVNVTCMTPNGAIVGGTRSAWMPDMYSSFLWNAATKTPTWVTSGTDEDTDKGGAYVKVTNEGVVGGIMKDKNLVVEVPGDEWMPASSFMLTTAAVWKDGKTYKLGIGGNDKDVFIDESDGSYISGISSDGNIASGYLQWGYFPQISVRWEYDAASDTYKGLRYDVPKNTEISATRGLSSDGDITVGQAFFDGANHAIVWTSVDNYRVIDLGLTAEDGINGTAAAVSSNGRYALICVNFANGAKLAVYDVQADKAEEVKLANAFEVNGYVIDDNGNFFCSITDNVSFMPKTHYYQASSKALIDMNYFVQQFAPGVGSVPDMNSAQPVAVSADGRYVAGNLLAGGESQGWWMYVNADAVTVPAVSGIKAFASGLGRITVKWNALTGLQDGIKVKEYKVSMDGQEVYVEKEGTALPDGSFSYTLNAEVGTHYFSVKAVCTHTDGEVLSPESEQVTAVIPATYEVPMFDDFESMSFDKNSWEVELIKGNETDVLNWNVSGGDFENNTYFASVVQSMPKPYKAALNSRFFDASQLDEVYLTFYSKVQYVNEISDELETDFLDVEYATDGENWTKLLELSAAEQSMAAWRFTTANLSKQLAGKQFRLRFVAHGEGKATLRWSLDYVSVNKELRGQIPEGLKAVSSNSKNHLIWKNSIGTYEMSYIANSNVLTDYNIGNEGKPLIVAVSFPAGKLSDFEGKYISSVTSFIFDDPSFSTKLTKAEAIVYADGVEVAREAFADDVASTPYSATTGLSTPVKIEAGKEYKVAVRIYDYDSQQTPLYYQGVEENVIPGLTDLYSEDEGQTWKKLSDFNAENEDPQRSWCVWPIRANISDSPSPVQETLKLDKTLLAYNVYRDGVQINDVPIYASYLNFIDNNPVEGAQYTVQAFYLDGRVSEPSEPVVAVPSSIREVDAKGENQPMVNVTADAIEILGECDNARLMTTDGRVLSTFGDGRIQTASFPQGVYILIVQNSSSNHTFKIFIK